MIKGSLLSGSNYDTLEKAKLWRQSEDQWLPEGGEEG